MKYSEEFVEAVKELFPTSEQLHQALESGSFMVGRYLNDGCRPIDPKRVIELVDGDQVQLLREEAERLSRINDLYKQWLDHHDRD
jgi:hypothetical protein